MAMSTFQKVTLATCVVLCVALLLPKMLLSRGRKDAADRPEGSARPPPMMHRQMAAEARGGGPSRAQSPESSARAKGAGTGAGTSTKSNLAGQIIPVYGFGILLYILYILFKITSKGSSRPSEGRFPSARSENTKRKITDFELDQLQEKLRETEMVMENIVSKAHHSPDRLKGVTADQEESLLQQLMEITRAMREGQLVDGVAPQEEEEEEERDDWEADPEEPRQHREPSSHCCCQHSQQKTRPERTRPDGAHAEHLPQEDAAGDPTEEAAAGDARPETGVNVDPGVPEEEDPAGVPGEPEKAGDPGGTTEAGAPRGAVRRRGRRKRAKRASR